MALRVSIGRYYSVMSPVHALDARVKFCAAIVYMVSCLFVQNAAQLALAGAAVVACIAIARVPLSRLLGQIRPVALFLVVTSLFNLFFVHAGKTLLVAGPVSIHSGGVAAAVLYTARFLFLLMAGSLLMLTTTPTALTDAVGSLFGPLERLGIPVRKGTLVLTIALRFVPTLSNEADNIVAAQTARGARLEGRSALGYARACVPLVVPLFASALRHADNLGRAMDARCYTGDAGRTRYHVMRLDARHDGAAIALAALYLAALVALGALS